MITDKNNHTITKKLEVISKLYTYLDNNISKFKQHQTITIQLQLSLELELWFTIIW